MPKPAPATTPRPAVRPLHLLIAVAVVGVVTAVVHAPVLRSDAVWIDDHQFVLDNPLVQDPGWASAERFVTEVAHPSTVRGYYKPLTMLSLMLDRARAARPDDLRPYRATNLGLHVATTVLLVVWLALLFGNVWAAALAGLLFGLHPLTVEPVAWVAGRKTMLATPLVMGALAGYVRWVQTGRRRWYVLCAVLFTGSVLAKPTTTLLPVLLLVLDWWPLRRLSLRAVWDKTPLLAIALVSGIVTLISQSQAAGVATPDETGLGRILLTVAHNVVFYWQRMLWPANLQLQYPVPAPLSLASGAVLAGVIGTVVLVGGVVVLAWRGWRAPLAGWLFWFVAILPTMGIVGVTYVVAADRYAYLPLAGLMLLVAAAIAWLWDRGRQPRHVRAALVAAACVLAVAAAARTRHQLQPWRNTELLHRTALAQTPGAYSVRYNLALELAAWGKMDAAVTELQRVVQTDPHPREAHTSLGQLRLQEGRVDEAVAHYRAAVRLDPDLYETQYNLGVALQRQGEIDEAVAHYRRAIGLAPDRHEAHVNLGNALYAQGRYAAALDQFDVAVRLRPDHARAHYNRGIALRQLGRDGEAIAAFRQVLRLDPKNDAARQQLAQLGG